MEVIQKFDHGSAADFHARDWPEHKAVHIWWFTPQRPALVLGSAQKTSLVDDEACQQRGIDVVRRRSGGGLVLLSALSTLWLDIIIPSDHSLWERDIGLSSIWLGELFSRVLTRLGMKNLTVHRGAMCTSQWSSLVCFAGRGPGEVFNSDGEKILGISQRRNRQWSRFQCVVSLRWEPDLLVALLREPRPDVSDLARCASTMPIDIEFLRLTISAELQLIL